jgi:outer membrane protein OmpA-like peptidoglycan-associated protein
MRRRALLFASLALPGGLLAGCGNRQRLDLASQPVRVVFFTDDSVALSPDAQGVIREVAEQYKSYSRTSARLQLRGFVAPDPGQAPLVSLARARAETVRNALVADGVRAEDVSFEGRGAASFTGPDAAVEARRVEIRFSL